MAIVWVCANQQPAGAIALTRPQSNAVARSAESPGDDEMQGIAGKHEMRNENHNDAIG